MALPPILDLFVVWHPDDSVGQSVFENLHAHFHSAAFSGLAGGAIDVYARSASWDGQPGGAPRHIPGFHESESEMQPSEYCVVLPVLGRALRDATQGSAAWAQYLTEIVDWENDRLLVLSTPVDGVNLMGSRLGEILSRPQRLPADSLANPSRLVLSVAQAMAQKANGTKDPIKVFVSHAKHNSPTEGVAEEPPYERVRKVLATTNLDDFFDARSLQPGTDWARALEREAGQCALLMIRTDRYATREWTQREVLSAKRHDVPIVGLIAFTEGEARGSFLLDHIPTIPWDRADADKSIETALSRLVDEALKRALWAAQSIYIKSSGFDWTPVHAPEPVTAIPWLATHQVAEPDDRHLVIIHPDPPLAPPELEIASELCALAGFGNRVDIVTPRTFAARGGELGHAN